MLTPDQIEAYHRDGFLVVPSVFTREEIAGFQRAGLEHARSGATDWSLHQIPGVSNLWLDSRLISLARALLSAPITYFAEATYARETFSENQHVCDRHLHHDAKGTVAQLFNRLHAASQCTYPVMRMGIYLQDYCERSGALKVSPGSHKIDTSTFDQESLPYANVATRPGDVVCFCLRTLHSGYSVRARGEPDLVLSPAEEDIAIAQAPGAFLPNPPVREALFVDYAGGNSPQTDLYIKNRACQAWETREGLAAAFHNHDMTSKAADAGIQLRMDAAVIEAVRKINRKTIDNVIKPEGIELLGRLPALCQHSVEFSSYFSIIPRVDVCRSLADAIALKDDIVQRFIAHRMKKSSILPDVDMQSTRLQPRYAQLMQS